MEATVAIVTQSDTRSAEVRSSIDLQIIPMESQNKLRISGPGVHELVRVLGDGFMERHFRLEVSGRIFEGCRLIGRQGNEGTVFYLAQRSQDNTTP